MTIEIYLRLSPRTGIPEIWGFGHDMKENGNLIFWGSLAQHKLNKRHGKTTLDMVDSANRKLAEGYDHATTLTNMDTVEAIRRAFSHKSQVVPINHIQHREIKRALRMISAPGEYHAAWDTCIVSGPSVEPHSQSQEMPTREEQPNAAPIIGVVDPAVSAFDF